MANVRCPMCSKYNPPEAEECAYCGARLKPIHPPSASSSTQPALASSAADKGSEEPDWLNSLRSDEPDAKSEAGQAADQDAVQGDVPDWLSRIRDRAHSETSSPPLFSDESEEGPDWLKDFQDESTPAQGSETDWLNRLPGGSNPAGESQPPTPIEPQQDIVSPNTPSETPDWLRSLADDSTFGSEPMSGPAEPAEDVPSIKPASSLDQDAGTEDWISKLAAWQQEGKETESPSSTGPAESQGTGQDDFSWLNDLGPEASAPPEQAGNQTGSGFGLTGFLSGEGNAQQPEQDLPELPVWGRSPDASSSGFGLTSFLSSMENPPADQSPAGESAQPVSPDEGGLEWLAQDEKLFEGNASSIPDRTGEFAEDAFPGWDKDQVDSGGELPAWLNTEQPPAQPGAAQPDETGLPDWLSGLGNEPSAPSLANKAAEQPSALSPQENVPDWLSSVSVEPPASPVAPAQDQPPSWLRGNEETPPQPVQSESGEIGLPDWLSGENTPAAPVSFSETPAQNISAGEDLPPAAEAVESGSGQLPTWLNEDASAAGVSEEKPAESEGELPAWFADFDQAALEKTQPRRTGALPPEPSADHGLDEAALSSAESVPSAEAAPSIEAGPVDEEVPDWLREFHAQAPTSSDESISALVGDEEALSPLAVEGDQPYAVDLPDWLAEDAAAAKDAASETEAKNAALQAAGTSAQASDQSSGEELTQADLPEWVKEMRPIESIIPSAAQMAEIDQRVEKAGPLAGLRGVLPAEDLVTRYRKPPIYSVKLHVTEKNRSQSSLLDSILAQESQPLLIPPARTHAPGLLVRVLIALLMLAVIVFALFPGMNFAPLAMPALYPPEMLRMFEQVDKSLKPDAPILLAVDYEPGLSGEMRLVSAAVVNHLIAKKANIVVISTVPTGPALADQLLNEAQKANTGYDLAKQTVNLGYMPGGTISLLEFAQIPQQAAPVTLSGAQAWQSTFLKDLPKDRPGLQGFSQVIVLTDRAESGRAWIEQVQPLMSNVPLYMVASAQAAPLLEPYTQSGQVAGMVSGLLGGAMYAQLSNQPGSAALNYLAAYQFAVVLAIGIVLVGGLISGGMALAKRDDKDEE